MVALRTTTSSEIASFLPGPFWPNAMAVIPSQKAAPVMCYASLPRNEVDTKYFELEYHRRERKVSELPMILQKADI
jgi:hypothetical protein